MTTERIAVYAVDTPPDPMLQCHTKPGGGAYGALYGWEMEPPPVDAGPPPLVEEVFAAALVQRGTLAFLAERETPSPQPGWTVANEGSWLRIPPTLADRLRRRPPPWIFATSSADHARRMFSGSVSWGQQHQVGFLLRPSRLPVLGRRLVIDVLRARDLSITTLALPDDVIALVLPAVDGDFLEVVARNESTWEAIRTAIIVEYNRRGVAFHVRHHGSRRGG